jgi:integrase
VAKALSAKSIENLKPETARREIPDGRGLYLVVQPSGVKSWAVRYRSGGKPRKLTLGTFPAISLAQARSQAAIALETVAKGADPAVEKRNTAKIAGDRAADTFTALARQFTDLYIDRHLRASTAGQYVRLLQIADEAWAGRSVHDIRRRDVVALLDRIAVDRPVLANRMLGTLSKFYRWLAARDVVENLPVLGVQRPTQEKSRDRVLSTDEIKRLWLACDQIGRIGDFTKLLLLTGQRRGEVGGMRWNEVNGDVWTIPRERVKNARVHTVPLPLQAVRLIERQARIGEGVWSENREGRFGATLARDKHKLDELMKPDAAWVFHDLRRTCVTHLSEMGFDRDLVELIVNHVSGSRGGVAGTYNRSERMADRRAALQRWADHIDQIVTGETAAVLPFGRRS